MISTQWESPRGLRKVESLTEREGRALYMVRTANNAFCDLMSAADIESQQALDARNLAYRAECEAKREALERAENERKANCPIERYLATLPAMKAGRARKSLAMQTRVNGGRADTRARHLLDLYRQGYRARGDKLECEGVPGYFTRDAFTSYGLELVAFIEREGVPA